MSYVNVLFALKDSHYQLLLDNFRVDQFGNRIRTDLTKTQARKLRHNYTGAWPSPTIGANVYHVLSFTFPEELEDSNDITAGHKWIEFLLTKWPNVWIVVGCWNRNGTQWGTTLVTAVYDDQGNEITPETVIGTPVYPVHPQHMRIMPDDVTYDENGNEVSRTPASAPKDVNLICGWSPRRWA